MPLYDYRCAQCAHEEEVLQSFNDPHLTDCPKCGQDSYKRQVSAPAFNFKGGGWYKDLYASSDSKKSKPAADGNSGSATKTETKKSESKSSAPKSD